MTNKQIQFIFDNLDYSWMGWGPSHQAKQLEIVFEKNGRLTRRQSELLLMIWEKQQGLKKHE